jgi:CubicO group peptidase (beta-lactamase class C family)
MRHRLLITGFVALALTAGASSRPELHEGKLAAIPEEMQRFVNSGDISGAVTLVARRDGVVHLEAVGRSDIERRRKMRTDDLFWVASMTKPIAAITVMMLQDEGKLSVDDPVEKYLPEFKNQWMVAAKSNSTASLVRAPRAITIRDLMTHTSGLGDVPAPRSDCSLAELVMAYSQMPLNFTPGSKWSYCNSGINTLGRIVEVISGTPWAEFVQKRVFDPLDMDDTTFWPTERQSRRVATSYQKGTNGLAPTKVFFLKGELSDRSRTAFPAGGLYSTAEDMAKFYRAMLNGGTLDGDRILSQRAAKEMTRTQSGDIRTGFVDGMSWGYGFAVVKEPKGVTAMLSPGTFGHGGAYGTQSWADPEKDLIMILMIQRAGLPNADASPMRETLQKAAVGALQAQRPSE